VKKSLYGGKHILTFHDADHSYYVDGNRKNSVTSILKILDKSGLVQWAVNQACDRVRHSKPFPEYEGEKAYIVTESDLKAAKTAYVASRDNSADIGTRVHRWIEYHIKGKDLKIEDDMKPGVESFLRWEEEFKPEYLYSERPLYSESLDLCGTTDVGIRINDKVYRLDFKTGKPEGQFDARTRRMTGRNRAYSSVYIQNAFYDIAIEEEDGERADGFAALYLPNTGKFHFYLTEETELYRKIAKTLLTLFNLYETADTINPFRR
jgi:hypothetical protein